MRSRDRFPHLLAVVVTGLLLVSCQPGDPAGAPAGGEPADRVEAVRAMWFGDPTVAYERDDREAWAARQEALRECMAGKGQAYVPEPYPSNPLIEEIMAEERRLAGTREYAERFGYGVTPTMQAWEVAGAYGERFPPDDPNGRRLAAMSPRERLAYLEALLGPVAAEQREDPSAWTRDTFMSSNPAAGCMISTSGGGAGPVRLPEQAWEELRAIEVRVAADPELRATTADWSACMRERGYDVADPEDARTHASDRTGGSVRVVGEQAVEVDGPDGEPVALTVVRYDQEQLQRVMELEIAVATADFDCRASSGYADVEREVRRGEQLRWVREWLDALPEPE